MCMRATTITFAAMPSMLGTVGPAYPASSAPCWASFTRHTANPGIAGESGLLARPRDPESIAAQANADEVLVSQTVTDLVVGSGLTFQERGAHDLKGVPGQWRLYAATP